MAGRRGRGGEKDVQVEEGGVREGGREGGSRGGRGERERDGSQKKDRETCERKDTKNWRKNVDAGQRTNHVFSNRYIGRNRWCRNKEAIQVIVSRTCS